MVDRELRKTKTAHLRSLLSCCVVFGAMSYQGVAYGQSLSDTLVKAWKNSPEIAAQRAQVEVFSEQAVQARSFGRVQVEGTVSLFAELDQFDEVVYPNTLSITATQPLYTGGQVENSTEAAEKRITAQEALLQATEQSVLLDAITAHSDVLRDEEFVRLAINNVRVLREQLRAAEERFDVGEVTRTDVEQARARLAASQSALAADRGSLEISEEAYFRVVGQHPEKLLPPPPLPDVPKTLEDAVRTSLVAEPTLLATRIERDATGSDVRAAIGALLPQVSLLASLQRNDLLEDNLNGDEDASIGVAVTIPFYTGGFNYSNVREAQAAAEGATADITAAERDAAQNVGIAWAQLDVARASIRAGRLEVQAARLAFDGVKEEAKVGARTTLDVLDAEQELLDARADLVESRRDEFVASYSLLSAIGKLTVEHLGLDVGVQTPDGAYYDSVRDRNFGYDPSEDTVWALPYRP